MSEYIQNTSQLKTGESVFTATYERVIGIDVHNKIMVCCSQTSQFGSHNLNTEHQNFGTTQIELEKLARWSLERDPQVIVFESTGIYWQRLYEILEEAMGGNSKLMVLNAYEVKAQTGRKTDWHDAKRITEYVRLGHGRPSFIPAREFRELRPIFRYMDTLKRERQRHIARLHKHLTIAGLRVSSVFSSIRGKAASIILEAVINGESGTTLKNTIDRNCRRLKRSAKEIYDAMQGNMYSQVWLVLRYNRAMIDILDRIIIEIWDYLKEKLKPYWPLMYKLQTICGIKEYTAAGLICELGDDLSKFPSAKHFASWLGICPGNKESAGKRYKGKRSKGNKYLRRLLTEVGHAAGKMKKSVLGARFRAWVRTKGKKKAVIAIAHKIARIIYAIYRDQTNYEEQGTDILKQALSATKKTGAAKRRAAKLAVKADTESSDADTGAAAVTVDTKEGKPAVKKRGRPRKQPAELNDAVL